MTLITLLVLATFVVLKVLLVVVPMRESFVIERLGKFRTVFQPGLHFMIPFIDNVAYRHEIREQVYDIPAQHCITKDNIQVEIDGLVYLKVMDPQLASYGIGDYRNAAINLAQTTMRSEVGKLSLGEIFAERETLNETIVREIDKASQSWGIKVYRYEVANISPSDHVVSTLEKQMVAERDRRADITLATAEKEAKINMSEGERQEAINHSVGERQRRINIAEGRAQEISLLAEAQATGIAMVAEAINMPGGNKAIKMRLVEQFVGELGTILEGADISVLPSEMARVKGIFEGVDQVTKQFKS
ncbi:stomatin-like protein [Reinekea marina]|uniref:SPFH domain-containing protein n=1 Tax=Reinekea marina TaxID=1310421 RepID=A0ABV7WQZ4_9GAMM|nr:stomatin-like protein [Reinekea marina]MDN3647794.1 stomatin-like protein [Reinekea marina]